MRSRAGLSSLALVGVGTAPDHAHDLRPTRRPAPAPRARRGPSITAAPTPTALGSGPIPCTTPARALLEAAARRRRRGSSTISSTTCSIAASPPPRRSSSPRSGARATGTGATGASGSGMRSNPGSRASCPAARRRLRLIRRMPTTGLAAARASSIRSSAERRQVAARPGVAQPRTSGSSTTASAGTVLGALRADVAREEALRALGWWIGRVDRRRSRRRPAPGCATSCVRRLLDPPRRLTTRLAIVRCRRPSRGRAAHDSRE